MTKAFLPNATNRADGAHLDYQALWGQYRAQKDLCDRLLETGTEEECEAAHKALHRFESALRADISWSVEALAAVLIIEIEDASPEEVDGLHRAALRAIRPQLVSEIGEAADRMLASATTDEEARAMTRETDRHARVAPAAPAVAGEPDPIFDLIKAHREAWARFVDIDDVHPEDPALHRGLHAAADAALDRLRKTPPATVGGARAIVEYFIEFDDGSVPFDSLHYLRTLARSPIFTKAIPRQLQREGDVTRADEPDVVFGLIEAHKKAAALFETPPTTLAGALALIRYLIKLDKESPALTPGYAVWPPGGPEIFEETGGFLRTLLPVFAGGGGGT